MKEQKRILLVDDEEDILVFLSYNLEKEGYLVKTAINGSIALEEMNDFRPHLILLDINMPGLDGIEVCQKIRNEEIYKDTLICFLTARSESFTQISALDSGGDDFISKPIKPKVFLSRINALMRRHPSNGENANENIKTFGSLIIDYEQYEVKISGEKILLAKKEFDLLKLLTTKPGKVYERKQILSKVWGKEVIVGDRTIDVHIRKLREKIGSDYIQTMKGVGYKFQF